MRHAEMLRGYLELVDRYSQMAQDPTKAGVAAVVTAGDILKAKGNDAAIEYFTKLLPDVKDPSIQRAIRIQLADLYKASGQADKALEQLKELMTAGPSTAPAKQ
jgi:predicted negative regulator of RcsB-dependent stress response